MKKILAKILAVFVIVGIVVLIGKGKFIMQGTSNKMGSDIAFFDDDRIYASEIRLTFNMETKDTYREKIELRSGKENKISVSKNLLTDNVKIRVLNENGTTLCEKTVEKGTDSVSLGKDYEGGKYTIEVDLPKNCSGTLEMKVDE